VVYIKPGNVDELAIKLSEIENIPLIRTDMDHKSISAVMNLLR
jgi:putative transcriptional regulator